MEKINITEKFLQVKEYWHPHIIGELNGQHVKAGKQLGEFVWHFHENEDELFLVVEGQLKTILFEPAGTLNTGNVKNELTKETLNKI